MSAGMTRIAALGVIALLLFTGTAHAKDKVWESEKDNVVLRILDDGSSTWEWLNSRPEWKKTGIVKAARRVVEKLKGGEAGTGQGAMMHLAIREVEDEEAKLADLAADDDVREFLLKRFSGDAEVEEEEGTVVTGTTDDGHPCIILRAEGKAPNLQGNEGKCLGVLVITTFNKKLYLLRLYAFPTEFDEEGVTVDTDYMEGNAFELISTKLDDKGGVKPPPPPQEGPEEGEEEEERTEPEIIENHDQKWRISIHQKLRRAEITEDEDADNLVLKIEHNDTHGGVMLYMYAPQTTQYVDGVKAAPPNLVKWMTQDWWESFTTTHPEGDLFTWKFPSKPSGKNPTFLVVPDMSNEKNRKGVVTGKKKRPVEINQSDATKKLKFVEKPKKNKIGKKGKGVEAHRGCLEGNRPRVGKETVLRYAWRSPSHSYRLFVIFTRDGYKKYGEPIRQTLESLEFVKKFSKK